MFIRIVITIFTIFVLSRVSLKYKKQEIILREFLAWAIFWVLVLGATLWPKATDTAASFVGIGRGADLLTYLSIIVLFFVMFKVLVQLKKIERDITKVVREEALKDKEKDKNL